MRGGEDGAGSGRSGVTNVEWSLAGLGDTEVLAKCVAAAAKEGDVVLLCGDVGAGKTTFARAFIREFTRDDDVTVASPSFLLHLQYPGGPCTLHHLDLYRLGQRADIAFLGLEQVLPSGVSLIEWPSDSLFPLLPSSYLTIHLREPTPQSADACAEAEQPGPDAVADPEEDGEFALPAMDGPRVVRAEAVGDRWQDWIRQQAVPLPPVA